MENIPLLLIFWYGILHAFAPDHLSVIADFSIGKSRFKTMFITIIFALGHGLSLFIFSKLLLNFEISDYILSYADYLSSSVIVLIGIYLLYLVINNKIHLSKHLHIDNKEHIHIWFGEEHSHKNETKFIASAFSLGLIMGIGGIRGMLITLSIISHNEVNLLMVFSFTSGVILVFILFGLVIAFINQKLLHSKKNIRVVFTTLGVTSILVGVNMMV